MNVRDPLRSAAFYQALLGGPPVSEGGDIIVFRLERPPVLIELQTAARPARAAAARYALEVPEPEHVGRAAVALWRVKAPLRLQDEGIESQDPDGNAWNVRFVPLAKEPAIFMVTGGA